MPRKLISFDWALKRLLRSKANFGILEGFLSELLFEDITILEILESESNKATYDDKSNRIDIKVKNHKEEMVLIEIQYGRELDYMQRMLYGTSKVISEHIKEGDSYAKIVKVVSINILYFDFGEGDDYIYKGTTTFRGMHNHSILKLNPKQEELYKTNQIDKIYPEYYVIKVNNFNAIAKDRLDEWIYFLKTEEILTNFQAKGLEKAKEVLDYLKMSQEEQKSYEAFKQHLHDQASAWEGTYVIGKLEGVREGIEIGVEQGIGIGVEQGIGIGIEQGIEQGMKQKELEIAKKSLQKGLDTQTIMMITTLSKEEIEGLK
jgi:predicted transposase/invertase (TIGR01784 family)